MLVFATATLLLVSVITTESSPLICSSLHDQGCSTSDWIKCTGVVAECASACGQSITSQSCISCLGDAASQCKDCVSLAEEIKYQEAIVQKIQASNAIGCSRWDWFKCAPAVYSARCSSECMEGLTSQACISHLGSSYDQCANCFALAETIKKSESLVRWCDWSGWVKCSLDIAECAIDCGSECISCIGESIEQCIGCLTAVDVIKNIESYKNGSGVHSKEDFSVFKTTNPTLQGCTPAERAKCIETTIQCAYGCGKTCTFCIANTVVECLGCIIPSDVIKEIESRKSDKDLHGIKKFSVPKTQPPIKSLVQGCDPLEWVECGLDIGECAVDCGWECISCIGESIEQCIGCLTAVDVIKNIESYKNGSGVHSKEDFSVFKTTNPTLQGCTKPEWEKCGGTILRCAFDCGKTCIPCIADTLLACLSCIPAADVIKEIESRKSDNDLHGIKKLSVPKTQPPIIQVQGCNPLDVAACAGVVARCAAECSAAEAACISCMGDLYSKCKDCF